MAQPPSAGAMPITMLVGDAVARISPEASLLEVADALGAAGVGALIVGEGEGADAIVSERDLVAALAGRRDPAATRAADVAHDTLVWCDADASVADVAGLMMASYVRHVLVEDAGRLVGVVSARDLLGVYASSEEPPDEGDVDDDL